MKKKVCGLLVLALVVALAVIPVSTVNAFSMEGATEQKISCTATIEDDFLEDRIIVVLNHKVSLKLKTYDKDFFAITDCVEVEELTKNLTYKILNKSSEVSQKTIDNYRQIFILKLANKSKADVLNCIKLLEQRDDVIYAGPNYITNIKEIYEKNATKQLIYKNEINISEKTANGLTVYDNWAIDKIELSKAQKISKGSDKFKIGVIDSGINCMHPDLIGRIDLDLSRDFTSGTEQKVAFTTDPWDHGTAVASIIGGAANASTNAAGVCLNAKFVSLRILDDDGRAYTFSKTQALLYAIDNNIPILNYSGGGYDESADFESALALYDGVFVCSAGNTNPYKEPDKDMNNDTMPHYPSNYNKYDNLISVGSSTKDDLKRFDSRYGVKTVDLFAPGDNIIAATANGKYDLWGGTSFAAPYVTGVVALLYAVDDTLTPKQIKEAITHSVDKLDSLNNYCVYGGRLNAYKALDYIHAVHTYGYRFLYKSPQQHASYCKCNNVYILEPHWAYASSICMYNGHRYATCASCKMEINIDINPIITISDYKATNLELNGFRVIKSSTDIENMVVVSSYCVEKEKTNLLLSYYDNEFFEKFNIVISGNVSFEAIISQLYENVVGCKNQIV